MPETTTELEIVPQDQSRSEKLARVNKRIEWLKKQLKEFQFEEIRREILETRGKFRSLERIDWKGKIPGGETQKAIRELLQDRDGSYVLPLTDNQEVIFLLQVRPGLEEPYQVELPAGGLDEGEEPLVNTLKELTDEAGAAYFSTIEKLGSGPVLSGRSPQRTHFFLAEGVKIDPERQRLERGELIIPFAVPLNEALLLTTTIMRRSGDPELEGLGVDPKIISALTLTAEFYQSQNNFETARQILSL